MSNYDKMKAFEKAAEREGFNTDRVYDKDVGIAVVFKAPHTHKKEIK